MLKLWNLPYSIYQQVLKKIWNWKRHLVFRFDLRFPIRYIPQNLWPIKVTPTFEEDATPEYITVTDDNKYAYIILQVKLITSHIYEPYIITSNKHTVSIPKLYQQKNTYKHALLRLCRNLFKIWGFYCQWNYIMLQCLSVYTTKFKIYTYIFKLKLIFLRLHFLLFFLNFEDF